jgi:hypothetical protein
MRTDRASGREFDVDRGGGEEEDDHRPDRDDRRASHVDSHAGDLGQDQVVQPEDVVIVVAAASEVQPGAVPAVGDGSDAVVERGAGGRSTAARRSRRGRWRSPNGRRSRSAGGDGAEVLDPVGGLAVHEDVDERGAVDAGAGEEERAGPGDRDGLIAGAEADARAVPAGRIDGRRRGREVRPVVEDDRGRDAGVVQVALDPRGGVAGDRAGDHPAGDDEAVDDVERRLAGDGGDDGADRRDVVGVVPEPQDRVAVARSSTNSIP